MPRRSSNVAVVCCLLIAIAIAAMWVRGLVARDQFTTYVAGRKCVAAVFPQHVYVIAYPAPVGSVATRFQAGLNQYPSRPIYWELRYHYRPGGAFRLGIPFWLPLVFAIAPPMWWVVQRVQTRRRRSHGLCRECGYDLRASRDRCPECGTPIPGERTRADGTANTEAHLSGLIKALRNDQALANQSEMSCSGLVLPPFLDLKSASRSIRRSTYTEHFPWLRRPLLTWT